MVKKTPNGFDFYFFVFFSWGGGGGGDSNATSITCFRIYSIYACFWLDKRHFYCAICCIFILSLHVAIYIFYYTKIVIQAFKKFRVRNKNWENFKWSRGSGRRLPKEWEKLLHLHVRIYFMHIIIHSCKTNDLRF